MFGTPHVEIIRCILSRSDEMPALFRLLPPGSYSSEFGLVTVFTCVTLF